MEKNQSDRVTEKKIEFASFLGNENKDFVDEKTQWSFWMLEYQNIYNRGMHKVVIKVVYPMSRAL